MTISRVYFTAIFFLCSHFSFSQAKSPFHIIPEPREIAMSKGIFNLNRETRFFSSEVCKAETNLFLDWLNKATGSTFRVESIKDLPSENFILINANSKYEEREQVIPKLPGSLNQNVQLNKNEGYRMVAENRAIIINAQNNIGAFYALQTLRQMFPHSSEDSKLILPFQFSGITITDEPHFSHRGLMLDCSRHFMSKEFILKYLDLLAFYKMNVFHWHLTDDQGWRIESEKYPKLHKIGAYRKEKDGSMSGGYYTKQEIRDIVKYAADRHITVIPEIEMPGHAVAAIAAYPELSCTGQQIEVENDWGVFKDVFCIGKDETFEFIESILAEVCELFPGPYIHIGGDEVPTVRWDECPVCSAKKKELNFTDNHEFQEYFTQRVARFLETKNKKIIGWDEILTENLPGNAVIQSWRGIEGGQQAAQKGFGAIMSPTSHCYFDYNLNSTDTREVFYFDPIPPGLSKDEEKRILGSECNMWTEHAPQELVDSKVFPRILAMSEVLWTYSATREYNDFWKRMIRHLERLDKMDVDFGFPSMPCKVEITKTEKNRLTIHISKNIESSTYTYSLVPPGTNIETAYQEWTNDITISEPCELRIEARFMNKKYLEKIIRRFDPHLAFGSRINLSNPPSPYYTGGGDSALTDGVLGTDDFRDGCWQAIQGKNMEAVVDLGEEKTISSISTGWYHYGNSWIFRPAEVRYQYSSDNINFYDLASVKSDTDLKSEGSFITHATAQFGTLKARYIKMIAINSGPCPDWHDASGEPSWLFCDEIVVR